MSKTKRFKKHQWMQADVLREIVRVRPFHWEFVPIERSSAQGRKKLARFQSDAKKYWMNWRGPAWFHNTFSQRPHRRRASAELKKFMQDPEHEVMIENKPRRLYWL